MSITARLTVTVILLTVFFLSTGIVSAQYGLMPHPTPIGQDDPVLPINASLDAVSQLVDTTNVNVTGQPQSFYQTASQSYIDDPYEWSLMPFLGYHFCASDRGHTYKSAAMRQVPISTVDTLLRDETSGIVGDSVPPCVNGYLMPVGTREDLQALLREACNPFELKSWPAESDCSIGGCHYFKFVSIGPEIPISGTDGNLKMTAIVTEFVIPGNNNGHIERESLYYVDSSFHSYRIGGMVL